MFVEEEAVSVGEEPEAAAGTAETQDMGSGRIPSADTTSEGSDKGFVVPDAYKDSGIAKKIKSADDLWKTAVNLDKLAGKKLDIPDWDNATDEQREQFFNRLRPETADAYQLPDGVNPENAVLIKEMLHKVGLSNYQAKQLAEKYMAYEQGIFAKRFDEASFEAQMKASFGENYAPALLEATATMRAHLSDADKATLGNIPNDQLGIMYRFAKNMADAYGAKETGAQVGGGESRVVDDLQGIISQRQDLMDQIRKTESGNHLVSQVAPLKSEYNRLTTLMLKKQAAGKAVK